MKNAENPPDSPDFASPLKALQTHTEQTLRDSVLERDRLMQEVETLVHNRNILAARLNETQDALNAALNSRAWRMAEKARVHMRRFREDWPFLHRTVRAIARTVVKRRPPPAVEATDSVPVTPPPSVEPSYLRWITESEPSAQELQAQRQSAESFYGPLISIVVPVHQTDHSMLDACIQSVVAQTYPHWQLWVTITPENDSKNREYLHDLAEKEPRVNLLDLPVNGGISRNTNAALAHATGKFVAFLDHDDTLAPFALYEVAERIKAEPDVDILYSDHDYLDAENGVRCRPLFKPAWSPSIMFSANYITHLTVMRRLLFEEVGDFDPSADGAQDWDLFLRATEKTKRISHIFEDPLPLAHARQFHGAQRFSQELRRPRSVVSAG